MSKKSKGYLEVAKKVDRQKLYAYQDAVALLKETARAKFDETVELAVRLGVDPRHADQNIRGTISLPNGTGKSVRVLVFAKSDKAAQATEAGADYVGDDELAEKIQGGWMDFDVAIATPDMMGTVGRLGRVLGPRGLMPNPKTGTVTNDVAQAVQEFKAGKIEYRISKDAIIHVPIGKISFESEKLEENLLAMINTLIRVKPASAKGTYMKSIVVAATMGPGIKIDSSSIAK